MYGIMHVKFEVRSFNHFEAMCGDVITMQ